MAADEDTKNPGKTTDAGDGSKPDDSRAGERRQRERRRAPVTIDLKAEPAREAAASVAPKADSAATPEPPKVESTKPEAAKAADAGGAEPPRPPQPERPSQPERPAARAFSGQTAARAAFAAMEDPTRRLVAAGVGGGLVALILVILLQAIGILPAPGSTAANEAAEQARLAAEATASLERRLTAVEAMVEGLPAIRTDLGAVDDRVTAVQAAQAEFAARGDVDDGVYLRGQLRQRIDALPPVASRTDLDQLGDRIGRLEVAVAAGSGDASGSEAAIASLADKLGAAESMLRSLTDRLAAAEAEVADLGAPRPMAGGEAAVRAIAITALRRASEGGQPFASEVDMIAALGVPGADIAALRPYAERGVPARATLVADFPAVGDAILSATAVSDPDAGFLDRMVAGLGSLVSIRPAGPIAGSDPPAIVSRMIAAVGRGDLATALTEREGLPESGRDASADWAAAAEQRVALDALVEHIAQSLGAA